MLNCPSPVQGGRSPTGTGDGRWRRAYPLGATKGWKVRARILAATNADLRSEIEAGRFREDWFFRLAMFEVEALPLRDRRDDIPLLVDHFATILSQGIGLAKPAVSPEASQSLIE